MYVFVRTTLSFFFCARCAQVTRDYPDHELYKTYTFMKVFMEKYLGNARNLGTCGSVRVKELN